MELSKAPETRGSFDLLLPSWCKLACANADDVSADVQCGCAALSNMSQNYDGWVREVASVRLLRLHM